MQSAASSKANVKISLFLKISLVLTIAVTLSFFISQLTSYQIPLWQSLLVTAFFLALAIVTVRLILNPIHELYQGLILLSQGQLKTRTNIHTQDELQALSSCFNQIGENLDEAFQKIQTDKETIISEKEKLEVILSSIGDGVIVLDLHRSVLMANQVVEEITGYTHSEMINKPIDELIALTNTQGAKIASNDYCNIDLKESAPPSVPALYTLTGKNNHKTEVRLYSSKIKGHIQANLGCILTLHNVSKEKVLHEMQIDFVSMASHELRTPLTSIVGYLSTILQEAKSLNDEQKKFLERALTSSQQLTSLVDNLLNVSRVERGAMSVNTQPIDLQDLITQVVEDNLSLVNQKNLTLRYNPPPNPLPKVSADTMRINEVITNLVGNAIKYTPDGGNIIITNRIDEDFVITSVTDNGPGIPREAIAHLFTKFFRVSGSLDQMQKGTGLGLYISKSIIELHHGKIWVDSEVSKGTTFSFSLPISQAVSTQPTIAQLHSIPN